MKSFQVLTASTAQGGGSEPRVYQSFQSGPRDCGEKGQGTTGGVPGRVYSKDSETAQTLGHWGLRRDWTWAWLGHAQSFRKLGPALVTC